MPFDGSIGPEVAARIKAHAVGSGPLNKVVNKRIDTKVATKVTLADALATSALLYNAETLPQLNAGQLNRLNAAMIKGYRAATALTLKKCGTNFKQARGDEVLLSAVRPTCSSAITMSRLKALSRTLNNAPPALVNALDKYPTLMTSTFLVYTTTSYGSPCTQATLVNCRTSTTLKVGCDQRPAKSWRALINLAQRNEIQQIQDSRRQDKWHRTIGSMYVAKDIAPPPFCPIDEQAVNYVCYQCGQHFNSSAGWHHHMRTHGVVAQARSYVNDPLAEAVIPSSIPSEGCSTISGQVSRSAFKFSLTTTSQSAMMKCRTSGSL